MAEKEMRRDKMRSEGNGRRDVQDKQRGKAGCDGAVTRGRWRGRKIESWVTREKSS